MTESTLVHIAFYKFVDLDDPDTVAARLRELTTQLYGNILVANEGINGVLAGSPSALAVFEQALRDDPCFANHFADILFKRSSCTTAPFARMKVHRKPEIVAFGVAPPLRTDAKTNSVSPSAWRDMIAEPDVIVLDNRNHFEFRLGHFKSATDPHTSHFRAFREYIEIHAPIWKNDGKRVAMYCTGGIRCEKTSAWMQELGLEVYQLEGGILNYFQAMPDAEKDWEGECFVFDNRIALNTKLLETGTSAEQVYAGDPDDEWRLRRARQLEAAVGLTPLDKK